jgi:ADP-ribose pyrophosphatase YjhB (NUDIX family)
MRVKARGVVPVGGRLVVARESRRGRELLTLPGGRPARGERLQDAVVREVREETGVDVRVLRLLYVAQVVAGSTLQELNVVFLTEVVGGLPADALLLEPGDARVDEVFPPILDRAFADLAAGWPPADPFLDNVHVPRPSVPS